MAIAVIIPEEERYAALVRHAAENDLLIVELQHLVLELRHDVANAEAATKIAQEATERLRAAQAGDRRDPRTARTLRTAVAFYGEPSGQRPERRAERLPACP